MIAVVVTAAAAAAAAASSRTGHNANVKGRALRQGPLHPIAASSCTGTRQACLRYLVNIVTVFFFVQEHVVNRYM
jgi:hypothetical protein